MALSSRKIDLIIADSKAGRFENITSLCKKHNISRKTYYGLEKKYKFKYYDNIAIVDALVVVEMAKSNKKVTELKSIDRAVKERVNTIIDDNKLVSNNRKLLIEAQKSIRESFENDEVSVSNIKQITGAIKDIEAVANPSTQKTEVNVNQTTQVQSSVILTTEEAKEKALSLGVPLECLLN